MHIVFDIGGTNMRVAAAEDGVLGEVVKERTPKRFEEGIRQLIARARTCAKGKSIGVVAGCIAGSVDEGIITDARNLPQWEGNDLAGRITNELQVAARVVNDAGAAGLGEAHYGAGKGASILAYITVSTGVGGARIVNGAIDTAGGIGRTPVRGSDLESLVSGTAVRKKFGIEPKNLGSLDERNKLGDILAEGLAEICKKWTPDTIVLGGSMITGINPIPLDRVAESLKKHLTMYLSSPQIKMASLGDTSGLYGGMVLAAK